MGIIIPFINSQKILGNLSVIFVLIKSITKAQIMIKKKLLLMGVFLSLATLAVSQEPDKEFDWGEYIEKNQTDQEIIHCGNPDTLVQILRLPSFEPASTDALRFSVQLKHRSKVKSIRVTAPGGTRIYEAEAPYIKDLIPIIPSDSSLEECLVIIQFDEGEPWMKIIRKEFLNTLKNKIN